MLEKKNGLLQLNSYIEVLYRFWGSTRGDERAKERETWSKNTRAQEMASNVWLYLTASMLLATLQQSLKGGESHG
jgi:hypothetical protein